MAAKRHWLDKVGRRGLRGGRISGGVPGPRLYFDMSDWTWAGGFADTMPSRAGNNGALVGGMGTPREGSTLNGKKGALFTQGEFTQVSYGNVIPTAGDVSFIVVVNLASAAQRQYILRKGTADNDDLIFIHDAVAPSGREISYMDSTAGSDATFHHVPRITNYLGNPQTILGRYGVNVVMGWSLKQGRGGRYFEDAVFLGSNPNYTPRSLSDTVLSGTKGAAVATTILNGNVWAGKVWNVALDDSDMRYEMRKFMSEFNIKDYTLVSDWMSIFGGQLVYLADLQDMAYVEKTDVQRCDGWGNRLDPSLHQAIVSNAAGTFLPEGLGGRGSVQISGATNQGYKSDGLSTHFNGVPASARNMLAIARGLGGGGQGNVHGNVMYAGSSTTDAREQLQLQAAVGATPAAPAVVSRRRDTAGTNRIATGPDPGATTVRFLMGTQKESPDLGRILMGAVATLDGTPDNCGTAAIDRFNWGHGKRVGDALTETTTFISKGVSAIVIGDVTTQQEQDAHASAVANRGAAA